ncbi:MAG: phosphoribosylformylglycinamidine synthase subunit PurL [Acidobacteriota bacterium]|jgi:phosphoribosylformylglycinamidine synthase II|nr:MAG: phosphoribosylformylglycinamidine synthase subunit PurL [Acidobacteriota bacterium]
MSTRAFAPEVLEQHGLTPEEYDRIVELLGREPNLTELGMFSVMWSEHCSYKSSRVHLKTLPTKGARVLQGPGENAGAVDIGDGLAAVFKIESHNHPSFIEPYQGAATGVGGIIRDIFTMGARPIALLDSLRFGPLTDARTRRIVKGVVAGIGGYGNSIGIPTVGGEVMFDESYRGNPLVNVFCLGIAKQNEIIRGQASGPGNPVYYVGAKTGRDGIHGATMASAEFDDRLEEKRPAVQVGDPFMEKLLLEACLELMKTDACVGMQDMGAAGLTCATSETGSRGGVGIEVDVRLVPQRETGMTPYEIMLSESQERMLIIVKRGREAEVEQIFEKWDLHAVKIGEVTADGLLRVRDGGTVVAEIPNLALTDEAPVYRRPIQEPEGMAALRQIPRNGLKPLPSAEEAFLALLEAPTIASKRWIYRQYDHMVRTNTIVLTGLGAAVVRVKGTNRALAMSVDGNGRYVYLDPRQGARLAVAEAARNVACAGGLPIGATNCLNFGNPERPEIMWQFAEAIAGMGEACRALDTPITGGNVSLYNETDGTAILPTPVVGIVGLLEDASKALARVFPAEGLDIVLFGANLGELGGSEYLLTLHGLLRGQPPVLDLERERALQQLLVRLAADGLIRSAQDCAEGGLAVALAECCFDTGGLGAAVDLAPAASDGGVDLVAATLFGESASRVIVSVEPAATAAVLEAAARAGVPAARIGTTGGDRIRIAVEGTTVVDVDVRQAERAWSSAIGRQLDTPVA